MWAELVHIEDSLHPQDFDLHPKDSDLQPRDGGVHAKSQRPLTLLGLEYQLQVHWQNYCAVLRRPRGCSTQWCDGRSGVRVSSYLADIAATVYSSGVVMCLGAFRLYRHRLLPSVVVPYLRLYLQSCIVTA